MTVLDGHQVKCYQKARLRFIGTSTAHQTNDRFAPHSGGIKAMIQGLLCGTKLPLLNKPFLKVDAVEAVFGVTSYFGITKPLVNQQVFGHLLVCVEVNGC